MKRNVLPDVEIANLLYAHGVRGLAGVEAMAVILAESGGNAWAVNINSHDREAVTYLSLDLGLCQFNTHWHLGRTFKTIPDFFDPDLSVRAMRSVSSNWTSFSAWTTWKRGRHEKFFQRSWDAFVNAGLAL